MESADLTHYRLTLDDTRQAEPRLAAEEGGVADNIAFQVKTRDAYRVDEPRGWADSVAYFLGSRYRAAAWEGGDYSSSLLLLCDCFRSVRPEVKSHNNTWVVRRAIRWILYYPFPEHALRPELGNDEHESLL